MSMFSLDAEQAVIGGLLIDPPSHSDVAWLEAGDFYRAEHREIWRVIQDLANEGADWDGLIVADRLQDSETVTPDYLAALLQAPSSANIKAYARVVREHAQRRELLRVADELRQRAEEDPVAETLEWAQGSVLDMDATGGRSGPRDMRQVMQDWVERQDERMRGKRGIQTGLIDLDDRTTGLHPGQLVYLAARPAMGKTAMALSIVRHAQQESPVLMFSMEMEDMELADRLVSAESRIASDKIRKSELADADYPRMADAVARLSSSRIFLDDSAGLTVPQMRARARRIKHKHGLGLIVVDYLQLLKSQGENRTREVGNASRALKALAKDMGCPVLALSQLNRSLEQRPNKRPMLSDLRESGDVEQDADMVLFLYRDEVYNPDTPDKGIAEVIIGKQRQGPIGTVLAAWDGDHGCFTNLAMPDAHGYWERKASYESKRKSNPVEDLA